MHAKLVSGFKLIFISIYIYIHISFACPKKVITDDSGTGTSKMPLLHSPFHAALAVPYPATGPKAVQNFQPDITFYTLVPWQLEVRICQGQEVEDRGSIRGRLFKEEMVIAYVLIHTV